MLARWMGFLVKKRTFEKIIWKDLEGLGRCSDGDCSKVLKVKMWFSIKIPYNDEEDNLSIHIVRERLRLGSSSSPSEKVWNYFSLHFKCFRHHDNYRHYHHKLWSIISHPQNHHLLCHHHIEPPSQHGKGGVHAQEVLPGGRRLDQRDPAKFWGGQKYFIAVWDKDKD